MTATRLTTEYLEKPWGWNSLPALFPETSGKRIGELWFVGPPGMHPPLLVKYLFTSERLSIQVHPDDAYAQAHGLPGGKAECWLVLAADPGAIIGMGTLEPLSPEALRAAALSGELERLIDWKPVEAGDFFFIPPGTVHAIGAGIVLVEVQQNVDITYRLFDYGRPRDLHLEESVAVSRAVPYEQSAVNVATIDEAVLLERGAAPFGLELMTLEPGSLSIGQDGTQGWFIPLGGGGTIDGMPWSSGQCWLLDGTASLDVHERGRVLLATL